jgi:hypothetical protein
MSDQDHEKNRRLRETIAELAPAPKPEASAEGRVLTTEELQGEREVYRAVKHFGRSTGNAQYVRAGLIDDLLQTLTAKDAEIARLTQERDAAQATQKFQQREIARLKSGESAGEYSLTGHLAVKDALIARLTQERDAAVAATVESCAAWLDREADCVQKLSEKGQRGIGTGTYECNLADRLRHDLGRNKAALELERVRAAIAEVELIRDEYLDDGGYELASKPEFDAHLAELQRREKELLQQLELNNKEPK